MSDRRTGASARGRGNLTAAVGLVIILAVGLALIPAVRRAASDAVGWTGDRWQTWTTTYRALVDEVPERRIEEQRRLAGSESLLIVNEDAEGRTIGLALLSRANDEAAVLALIPPGLFTILPGYGEFAVSEATVFEGTELTELAVSNALGVRIDGILELGPGALAGALQNPLEVDLPTPLLVAEGGGTSREVAAPGLALRAPELVEVLLGSKGEGGELEWLERQAAVWEAIIARLGSDPATTDRLAAGSSDDELATGILARATEGEPQVTLIPVDRAAAPGGGNGFTLDSADALAFVDRRMAHLALAEGERSRVEILNGNGRVLTTRAVAELLVRRGFRIVKTDNAENFDFEETLVIAQGREHRAEAERALQALGVGSLLLELRAPSGVVDVSIIVGQDVPAGEGQ